MSTGKNVPQASLAVTPATFFGVASPSVAPLRVGDFYLDTNNKKLYIAVATATSGDWVILN